MFLNPISYLVLTNPSVNVNDLKLYQQVRLQKVLFLIYIWANFED